MKFSILTFALSLLSSSLACTTFRIRIANSPDSTLNGLYLQSLNSIGTLGPPFTNITFSFPTPDLTTASPLLSTGVPGDGSGMIMLAPSLGVERIIFADTPSPGARYTEWSLLKSTFTSTLVYGEGLGRFAVHSPPSPIAHYEIYLVAEGATFHGGSEVDLVVEWI